MTVEGGEADMPLYIQLLHYALSTELTAVLPTVAILLIVGLVTAILQAALQIEDATFSLLPKTFAMILIVLFGGLGAMQAFQGLAVLFITHAPALVHQSWS
jgi:flagellar biosynthetic protein FliQ